MNKHIVLAHVQAPAAPRRGKGAELPHARANERTAWTRQGLKQLFVSFKTLTHQRLSAFHSERQIGLVPSCCVGLKAPTRLEDAPRRVERTKKVDSKMHFCILPFFPRRGRAASQFGCIVSLLHRDRSLTKFSRRINLAASQVSVAVSRKNASVAGK